jgi:hypothetical protein
LLPIVWFHFMVPQLCNKKWAEHAEEISRLLHIYRTELYTMYRNHPSTERTVPQRTGP